jgi:hypothetical protein
MLQADLSQVVVAGFHIAEVGPALVLLILLVCVVTLGSFFPRISLESRFMPVSRAALEMAVSTGA